MSLESLLNNPNRTKHKMTRRDRIRTLQAEMEMALDSCILLLEGYYHTGIKPGILTIVGTQPSSQRQALGYYLNQDKLDRWIILGAGRTARHDQLMIDGADSMPTFIITAEDLLGEDYSKNLYDLLEIYVTLKDGLAICTTEKRKHAIRAKYGLVMETDVRQAIAVINHTANTSRERDSANG